MGKEKICWFTTFCHLMYTHTSVYTHAPSDKGNQAWYFKRELRLKKFPVPKGDSCLHMGPFTDSPKCSLGCMQSDEAEIVCLGSCRNSYVNMYSIRILHVESRMYSVWFPYAGMCFSIIHIQERKLKGIRFIHVYFCVKWSCPLLTIAMYHSHKSVFRMPLNQMEGNGVFRAWAHTALTGISIAWILSLTQVLCLRVKWSYIIYDRLWLCLSFFSHLFTILVLKRE